MGLWYDGEAFALPVYGSTNNVPSRQGNGNSQSIIQLLQTVPNCPQTSASCAFANRECITIDRAPSAVDGVESGSFLRNAVTLRTIELSGAQG